MKEKEWKKGNNCINPSSFSLSSKSVSKDINRNGKAREYRKTPKRSTEKKTNYEIINNLFPNTLYSKMLTNTKAIETKAMKQTNPLTQG
jgi:hypothetical protein